MAQTDIETAPEKKEDGTEPVDRDIHLVCVAFAYILTILSDPRC